MIGIGWVELLVILLILGALVSGVVVVVILSTSKRRSISANPDLLPCPDCGRYVSRLAITCPNCGRPLGPAGEK